MRTSPEAISGYSAALAAVLGGVYLSPLGVPHTKGKVITILTKGVEPASAFPVCLDVTAIS